MYRPKDFSVDEPTRLFDAIEEHSFATLISVSGNETSISHLPLLLDRHRGDRGTLIGHFARANDHWRDAQDSRVVAVFHGPHAYMSPRWYESDDAVPTWNYVAVHATGVMRLAEPRDMRMTIVRRFVEHYEQRAEDPWSLDRADPQLVDSLLDAIVAFEIPIDCLEGKWKLSQNHSAERRQLAMDGLTEVGSANSRAIAELMRREDSAD